MDTLTPRDALSRMIAVAAIIGIGAVHIIVAPHKFSEAPYMGVLFIALALGCAATVALLTLGRRRHTTAAWSAVILVAVAPTAGFALSRTVALPAQEGHVGLWVDPVGVTALVFNAVALGVAVVALADGRMRVPLTSTRATKGAVAALMIASLTVAAPLAYGHGDEGGAAPQTEESLVTPAPAGDGTIDDHLGGGATTTATAGATAAASPAVTGHGEVSQTPSYMSIPTSAGALLLLIAAGLVLRRRIGPVGD